MIRSAVDSWTRPVCPVNEDGLAGVAGTLEASCDALRTYRPCPVALEMLA